MWQLLRKLPEEVLISKVIINPKYKTKWNSNFAHIRPCLDHRKFERKKTDSEKQKKTKYKKSKKNKFEFNKSFLFVIFKLFFLHI